MRSHSVSICKPHRKSLHGRCFSFCWSWILKEIEGGSFLNFHTNHDRPSLFLVSGSATISCAEEILNLLTPPFCPRMERMTSCSLKGHWESILNSVWKTLWHFTDGYKRAPSTVCIVEAALYLVAQRKGVWANPTLCKTIVLEHFKCWSIQDRKFCFVLF